MGSVSCRNILDSTSVQWFVFPMHGCICICLRSAEALEGVESVREWFGFDSEMVLPGGEPVVGQRCWSRDRTPQRVCDLHKVCDVQRK